MLNVKRNFVELTDKQRYFRLPLDKWTSGYTIFCNTESVQAQTGQSLMWLLNGKVQCHMQTELDAPKHLLSLTTLRGYKKNIFILLAIEHGHLPI